LKSILFIRGGALGDFILTLPSMHVVRERFPAARVEVMGYSHIAALVDRRFYANAVRSIEQRSVAGFFAARGDLDPELSAYFASFETVVSWLYDPDFIFSDNLKRAGVTRLIRAEGSPTREVHATEHLAKWLFEFKMDASLSAPRIYPSAEDRAQSLKMLARDTPRVALHIGSGSPAKTWPAARFAEIATWLQERGVEVLIIQGPADMESEREFSKHGVARDCSRLKDLTLPVLSAVLEQCLFFLGHDSGISHLAAAVGIPTIALFGPTDPALWAPRGPSVTVLRKNPDLASLSVEDVKRALEPRLQSRRR